MFYIHCECDDFNVESTLQFSLILYLCLYLSISVECEEGGEKGVAMEVFSQKVHFPGISLQMFCA